MKEGTDGADPQQLLQPTVSKDWIVALVSIETMKPLKLFVSTTRVVEHSQTSLRQLVTHQWVPGTRSEGI